MRAGHRGGTALSVLGLLLASACGGGGGGSPPTPAPVGDGTFRAATPASITVGSQPTALVAGDWNSDDHLDLAVGNHLGGTISILLGTGTGAFQPGPLLPLSVGNGVFDLRAGRLDADADLDLVVADANSGSVSLFLGNGDGSFALGTPLVLPGADDVMGVALADLNGDLLLDVVATARAPGTVGVFLGNGNGTFQAPLLLSVGFEARQTTVGDWNGDQAPDLVVSIRNGQTLEVFLGNGNGTFSAAAGSPLAAGGLPWVVAAADFDGNGTTDLAAPGDTSNAVALFAGTGTGAFAPAQGSPLAAGTNPYGIVHGDLNGDARPDLVVANLQSSNLSVFLGSASGFLPAPNPTIPTGANPFAMQLADFDGDGILDLAVANEGSDTVTVLLGNAR